MSMTKSHSPSALTSSMTSSQTAATRSRMAAMVRGVKPELTSLRRCVCIGGSILIICGRLRAFGRIPEALEKVAASVLHSRTSAYLVTP